MGSDARPNRQRLLRRVLPVLAIAAFVLAVVGYGQYLPTASFVNCLFYALNLMVLNFYSADAAVDVPLPLDVARYLAHFVAGGTLLLTVLTLMRARRDHWNALRKSGHVAVIGSSPLAIELAKNYASDGPVCAIGANEDHAAVSMLRNHRILVVDPEDDADMVRVLHGATRIVIAEVTDAAAVRALTRIMHVADQLRRNATVPPIPVIVIVENPQLARSLKRSLVGHADLVLDVACAAERVVLGLLREFEPVRDDMLRPPPVVIGSGPVASEMVHRLLVGWQSPGEHLDVMCFGPDVGWAHRLRTESSVASRLNVLETTWSPELASRAVAAHTQRWRTAMPARSDGRAEAGPIVYLVGLDDATAFTTAANVARRLPSSTIVALVSSSEGWSALSGDFAVRSMLDVLSDTAVIETNDDRQLAEALYDDHLRWPTDIPTVFGASTTDRAISLRDLPDESQAPFLRVAAIVPEALVRNGCSFDEDGEPALLYPNEIVSLATELRAALWSTETTHAPDTVDEYRMFEFVARLPQLVCRAGFAVARQPGTANPLSLDQIELLARAAHSGYRVTSITTGNATESDNANREWADLSEFTKESNRAQIRDIPVKLACAGRQLVRASDSPHSQDSQDSEWLTDELAERLGHFEHRRWEYVHRLARYRSATDTDHQQRTHKLLTPWENLTDDEKHYDFDVVRQIPAMLAQVGLTTVAMHSPGSPS